MALKAVAFDVGETLVDETRMWSDVADAVGVPRFTFFGVLGGLVARGEHHRRVFDLLGVDRPGSYGFARPGSYGFAAEDLYADARPCLAELRRRGYLQAGGERAHARIESLRELPEVLDGI